MTTAKKTSSTAIKRIRGDVVFDVVNASILIVMMLVVLYPLIYVVSCSVSSPLLVVQSKVVLFPKGMTKVAYEHVLNNSLILSGYGNTILYTLLGTSINWLSDTTWTFPIICILSIWLASGINFIFIGAGLRNIPEELYESAAIDGAGYWKKLRNITLPCLSPTLFFQIIVNIINAFQSFTLVKLLTSGGPQEKTNLIVYSIYLDAFRNFRFGTAAARSIVLFVIIMVITLLQFSTEKRSVHY